MTQEANIQPEWRRKGPIFSFLARDHDRLGFLLDSVLYQFGEVDRVLYAEFRAGLLKHIAMEEKILLPAAQRLRGGEPLPIAGKLKLDHGVLAALLVPTPTPAIIAAIQKILDGHNALEEGPGGLYEACDELAGSECDLILAQLKSAPEVKVAPHVDGPHVMEAARGALARAGYEMQIGA